MVGCVKMIDVVVKECDQCQRNKITSRRTTEKYRQLTTQECLLETLYMSIFLKILTKQVQCFAVVDKATGWPEIMGIDKKRESIATLFGNEWLSRYPRPRRVVHDNGGEFVGYEFQELLDNYGILSVSTTIKTQEPTAP